jgi:hypothetical protein
VSALLTDPLSTTTAMITAALASGRPDIVLAGGRLVQAILKGRAYKQLGQELDELLKKGKIRKDYADTKYGFQSLVDLMKMIDTDAPDEDKLRAAKAMFVALNAPTTETETFLRYQLFRLVLTLSGSQVAVLSICNKLRKEHAFNQSSAPIVQNWLNGIANHIGHRVLSLIEQDEAVLMRAGVITPRFKSQVTPFANDRPQADPSGVDLTDARLSDLGVKICELVESYSGEISGGTTSTK